MKNIIKIKNAQFYAYHGAYAEEQSIGGKYEVDVEMETDFSDAAENDDLNKTINYLNIYNFLRDVLQSKKYYLIETIAKFIADELLKNYSRVNKLTVRVRKHSVPVGGVIDYVEAEVIKEQGE